MTRVLRFIVVPMFLMLIGVANAGAAAQLPPPDYDFDWATIGDAGNPGYEGLPGGGFAGRGRVDYEYRMSKLEVTSAQWLEFINVFAPQSDDPGSFLRPSFSGMRAMPGAPAGVYELDPGVRNAGMVGVYGITWRESAMFVNWLHNGKSDEWSAIQDGAYDVSTFGINPKNNSFTDQVARSPDALFWIPTLDEWIKSVHYDPNRYSPGEGGWWTYPYLSNDPPMPGLPGDGQTSAGVVDPPGYDLVYHIPLGSYPDAQTPWGLWDASGGAKEWTEETESGPFHFTRGLDGSVAGDVGFSLLADQVFQLGYSLHGMGSGGLRVASAVPAPFSVVVFALCLVKSTRRRQTR